MGSGGLRVGTVRGVEVRIDASWLLIAVLVTWSYWERFDARGEHAGVEAFVMAVVGSLLFFGSILAHELAHALEAQHRGVRVEGITLFLFGGVTQTRFDVRRPVDEFALTAVGPFMSFTVAAILGLVAFAADEVVGWAAVGAVAGLVAWVNVALGVFNLLPGAPLDGGRILRAAVWWVTHDRQRAIRTAAHAGRVVGGIILGLGLLQAFFVPAALLGGFWLAFIGWFLLKAAGAELAYAELHSALDGITAGQLADRREPVAADSTIAAAIERFRREDTDLLTVHDGDATVGILGIDDVRPVERERRTTTRVREAMRPISSVASVAADTDATTAISELPAEGVVAATDGGRVVGLITMQQIATLLCRTQQFDATKSRRRTA